MGRGRALKKRNTVEIIVARAPAIDEDAALRDLPEHEIARAQRFKIPAARAAFVGGRAALRRLLGDRLHQKPASVGIEILPSGKPVTVEGDWRFSISHTDDWVAIAVSRDIAVGIDIERRARQVDALSLAQRFFPPTDAERVARLSGSEQQRAFLEIWTLREAFVKAIGATMSQALAREFVAAPAERRDADSEPNAAPAMLRVTAMGRTVMATRDIPQLPGELIGVVAVADDRSFHIARTDASAGLFK